MRWTASSLASRRATAICRPYVRDKDAVIGSMLICEMAAYYRSIGSSIKQRLEEIYKQYGRYLNKVDSFEFPA